MNKLGKLVNRLLLSMNSTNKTLVLYVRLLIMCDFVFVLLVMVQFSLCI